MKGTGTKVGASAGQSGEWEALGHAEYCASLGDILIPSGGFSPTGAAGDYRQFPVLSSGARHWLTKPC